MKDKKAVFEEIVEQCRSNQFSSINVASKVRGDAIIAADRKLHALQARIDRVVMMIGRTLGSMTPWEEIVTLYGNALADARDILGGENDE